MLKRALMTTMALALGVAGCASSGGSGQAGGDSNVITRVEIESVNVADLHDVVQRLRPRWLQVRAGRSFGLTTGIVVFQGNTYLGGPEVLKDLGRDVAETLRYLDATRAAALPGVSGQHVEGAIVIERRMR